MKTLASLIVLSLCLLSCNQVHFKNSQPLGTKSENEFPKEFQGTFKRGKTLLIVDKTSFVYFDIPDNNRKKGILGSNATLKKFEGKYFVSLKTNSNSNKWYSGYLRLEGNNIKPYLIYGKSFDQLKKAIKYDINAKGDVITIDPSVNELRSLLDDGLFISSGTFNRISTSVLSENSMVSEIREEIKKEKLEKQLKQQNLLCKEIDYYTSLNSEKAKSSINYSTKFMKKYSMYYNSSGNYASINISKYSFTDAYSLKGLKNKLLKCNDVSLKSENDSKITLLKKGKSIVLEKGYNSSHRIKIYFDKPPLSKTSKKCISGDCQNGFGKITYGNGDSYEGIFKSNKMEGQGTYYYKDGWKHIGVFKNNLADGEGKQYNKDGKLTFEGKFYGGKLNGYGKSYDKSNGKLIYKGNWKNGIKEGSGTEYFLNGSYYTGQFVNGKIDGQGATNWPNGDRYVGAYKNGKREGQGTYYFASGSKHIGENKKGKFNGLGKKYSKSGKLLYEGNYLNSKLDGFGTKYYTDGKYVGMWKEGKRNGAGKFYNLDGKLTYDGQWENDKTISKSTLKTNTTSKGCVKGNCTNGWGKFIYDNGSYEGFFLSGKKNGYGSYQWNNGDKYFGNWKNNIRQGFGQYIWKNNTKYEGEWTNGKITGYGEKKELNNKYNFGYWENGNLKNKYNFTNNKNVTTGCIAGNCQNGYGKFKWDNGDTFQGFFINGKRRIGRYTYASGSIYFGEFSLSGSFDGSAFFFWKDKSYYAGQYKNNKRDGLGYYKNANTNKEQIGEWKNGVLSKSYK